MRFCLRLVVVTALALDIALVVPYPSNAATAFQYLIDAANQIKQIEYSKAVLSDDDNGRIAKVACDALSRLTEDPSFKNALTDILSQKNLGSSQSLAVALAESLANFNTVFLPAEIEIMRSAGLEYPVIFDGLQIASRERIRANLKEVSAVDVMGKVQAAKETVCKFAAGIVKERERRAVQWTFGGVVLIGVDVAAAIGIGAVSSGALAVAAGAVIVTSIGVGADAANRGAKGDIP